MANVVKLVFRMVFVILLIMYTQLLPLLLPLGSMNVYHFIAVTFLVSPWYLWIVQQISQERVMAFIALLFKFLCTVHEISIFSGI
jgi:hypothetical protein